MDLIGRELTDQERVATVSSLFAIYIYIVENHPEMIDKIKDVEVSSSDISHLTDLDINIVNAALENLHDDGLVIIDERVNLN